MLTAALMLTGCNGIFSDIYDAMPSASAVADGFSTSATDPVRLTLRIDASDFGKWHYVSLKNKTVEEFPIPLACEGEWDGKSGITYNEVRGDEYLQLSAIPTDPQQEPAEWDFAIHRFDVRTHGGSACVTGYRSLDELPARSSAVYDFVPDVWSTTQVMTDMTSYGNRVPDFRGDYGPKPLCQRDMGRPSRPHRRDGGNRGGNDCGDCGRG